MGGAGSGLEACALEVYREWAACHHFSLYDDVAPVLRQLAASGVRIGLISNTHRCLDSFQSHFELGGLIRVALSSHEHGYMKPHPSIFESALAELGVPAGEAVMVGDSLKQDIEGALNVGMRGVLVRRSTGKGQAPSPATWTSQLQVDSVPVIRTLYELPALL